MATKKQLAALAKARRKWKSMSKKARAKAMPGGRKRKTTRKRRTRKTRRSR